MVFIFEEYWFILPHHRPLLQKRLPINPLPRRLVQRIRQCPEDGREGRLAHARRGDFVLHEVDVNCFGRFTPVPAAFQPFFQAAGGGCAGGV